MLPIPLHDNVRRQTFWISTLALIAANAWVFFYELSLGGQINQLVHIFGIVPARYTTARGLATPAPVGFFLSVFVSMFLHAGWLHLLGNMLFLFVFGRSIEDRFGHLRFLLMYFLSGFGAAVLHILFNAGSRVPSIGASGAIAGVLGAYFVSFPAARIATHLLFFFWTVDIPALLFLGYWFLIQFFTGFQMLAIQTEASGGVAWWAHVGGFLVGVLLALILPTRQAPAPSVSW